MLEDIHLSIHKDSNKVHLLECCNQVYFSSICILLKYYFCALWNLMTFTALHVAIVFLTPVHFLKKSPRSTTAFSL